MVLLIKMTEPGMRYVAFVRLTLTPESEINASHRDPIQGIGILT